MNTKVSMSLGKLSCTLSSEIFGRQNFKRNKITQFSIFMEKKQVDSSIEVKFFLEIISEQYFPLARVVSSASHTTLV